MSEIDHCDLKKALKDIKPQVSPKEKQNNLSLFFIPYRITSPVMLWTWNCADPLSYEDRLTKEERRVTSFVRHVRSKRQDFARMRECTKKCGLCSENHRRPLDYLKQEGHTVNLGFCKGDYCCRVKSGVKGVWEISEETLVFAKSDGSEESESSKAKGKRGGVNRYLGIKLTGLWNDWTRGGEEAGMSKRFFMTMEGGAVHWDRQKGVDLGENKSHFGHLCLKYSWHCEYGK